MPTTPAERAKKYRDSIKANSDKHKKYLEKERKRYYERKARGQFCSANKTDREKRSLRRQWRRNKRNERNRKKMIDKGTDFMSSNSPESVSSGNEGAESKKMRGRKKVRKDRAKAYRTIKKLEGEVEKKEKSVDKFRKRWVRLKSKVVEKTSTKETEHSASSSVTTNRIPYSEFVQAIREKYEKQKTERAKNFVARMAPEKLLKKVQTQKEILPRNRNKHS